MSWLTGAVGGLVASIAVAALATVLGGNGPSLPARLLARVGDGSARRYRYRGLALVLAYGTVAGAAFVPLAAPVVSQLGLPLHWDVAAVIAGVVWGIVLLALASGVGVQLALGQSPDRRRISTLGVYHLVYGLVLGGWIGYVGVPS